MTYCMLDDMSLPGRDPAGTALSSSLSAPDSSQSWWQVAACSREFLAVHWSPVRFVWKCWYPLTSCHPESSKAWNIHNYAVRWRMFPCKQSTAVVIVIHNSHNSTSRTVYQTCCSVDVNRSLQSSLSYITVTTVPVALFTGPAATLMLTDHCSRHCHT